MITSCLPPVTDRERWHSLKALTTISCGPVKGSCQTWSSFFINDIRLLRFYGKGAHSRLEPVADWMRAAWWERRDFKYLGQDSTQWSHTTKLLEEELEKGTFDNRCSASYEDYGKDGSFVGGKFGITDGAAGR
nr:HLA class I histocompatibility antigen [Eptesicus fuscus gammaherpesvirus]